MRTLIVGDIHGRYGMLLEALEAASYDAASDLLIGTGDLVDRGPESAQVLEFFACPRRLSVRGNHDEWALAWLRDKHAPDIWTSQGGLATMNSLEDGPLAKYRAVLEAQEPFLEHSTPAGRRILVLHAGFDPTIPLDDQDAHALQWDRTFFHRQRAVPARVDPWDRIFLGHTVVSFPERWGNVWTLDTGAGWHGAVTVMDADTEEFWCSAMVAEHYETPQVEPSCELERSA